MMYNVILISGCGPVGRALDLGAEGAASPPFLKHRKRPCFSANRPTFPSWKFGLFVVEFSWPHVWPHLVKLYILYPGIAQLVGRVLWEHQAARSSRATRTKPSSFRCENWRVCYLPINSWCRKRNISIHSSAGNNRTSYYSHYPSGSRILCT